MGCGSSSQPKVASEIRNGAVVTYPPSEAFEVSLNSETAESVIKKHPPKRLRRLEGQTISVTTIEDLEEKLATAEIRRQEFLNQRANAARRDKSTTES